MSLAETTRRSFLGDAGSTGGAPGYAIEGLAYRAVITAGLDRKKDLASIVSESLADSNAAVKTGMLDAYVFSSGIPTPAVTKSGSIPGVELVDMTGLVERFIARYGPVYFFNVIPAGAYPGQDRDNLQVSVTDIFVVASATPDARVIAILSALWANQPKLIEAHPEATHLPVAARRTAAVGVPWRPVAAASSQAQGGQLA